MEHDRDFAQLLDQLRGAHESLRHEQACNIAALEAEVAQLRQFSSVSRIPRRSGLGGDKPEKQDKSEKQDKAALESEVVNTVSIIPEICQTSTAKINSATMQSPASEDLAETGVSRRESVTSHHDQLTLKQQEESRIERLWKRFDAFIGGAIIVYTAILWIGLQVDGVKNGKILVNEIPPDFSYVSAFVEAMNHVFNIVFLVEFLIRVYYFRTLYFYDKRIQWFNLFDGLLVWLTIIEAYVLSAMSVNVSYIRWLRIIRLLRSLRVARTFRFFSSLRILMQTIAASYVALFWSMVLLAIVMLIGALSLCQLLGDSITDNRLALGTRSWVNRFYGTPGRSFWTMFEITFSGCWPNYARILIEDVSSLYVLFFIIYIAGVVFAMTRIITALFLKDTLAIANNDADQQINTKMKEKQAYGRKLQAFFDETDNILGVADGFITEAEFVAMLKEPRAAAYLAFLEIDATESLHLFRLIDDGQGRISSEEFVKSALQLKGAARAQDLVILMHEFQKMKHEVNTIRKATTTMHEFQKMKHEVTHEMLQAIHARSDHEFRSGEVTTSHIVVGRHVSM